MPYARKYKRTTRGRRFFRRRNAAKTLQGAWRNYKRRKRGGLVTRTALSNRRAIKQIKSSREVKYATAKQAGLTNNFVGQHVIFSPDVFGFNNQGMVTPTWTGGAMTVPPVPLGANVWKCCNLKPLCIPQGDGSGEREGEYVQLRWINIKGTASSYNARYNGTGPTSGYDYKNMPQRQRVRIVIVLDTAPEIKRTPTAWDYGKQNCTLFNMKNPSGVLPGIPVGADFTTYLRNGPKCGEGGAQRGDGTYDPWPTSYWENNYCQSKSAKTAKNRFKVLKVLQLGEMRQPAAQQGDDAGDVPAVRNFSYTLKAPYKLHFANDLDDCPNNQQIYVMVQSTTLPAKTGENDIQVNYIRSPKVELQCKVAYIDP